MGHGSRAFLAGTLGFAVAFVVACGGQNGLLDSNQASILSGQLSSVSSAVSNHNCGAADTAAHAFRREVSALPAKVNKKLVANLKQGATTVSSLAARDCSSTSSSSSSSSSSSTTSSSTPTTSSNPTTSSPSSSSSTATNPPAPSNNTTSNGGVGLGGAGGGGGGNGIGGAGAGG